MLIAYAVEAVLIAWLLMLVQRDSKKKHKQQTETLAMESCCVCREGMKSKNWKVVRDVDVFKILVQLAASVVQ